ncbi:hypothetical protein F4774DRAFT_379476 [Daldinia eschscholtzii]|nr:hypothetical protein F4774DRAFT_379476 [Daldinia eschscholtzii]
MKILIDGRNAYEGLAAYNGRDPVTTSRILPFTVANCIFKETCQGVIAHFAASRQSLTWMRCDRCGRWRKRLSILTAMGVLTGPMNIVSRLYLNRLIQGLCRKAYINNPRGPALLFSR